MEECRQGFHEVDSSIKLPWNANRNIVQDMQVRASHILVRDKALADRIYEELKKGASFADLARRYSTCPSRSKGGDLGFFGEGQMVREFEKEAFRLPYGSISRPVHTKFGWHIIRKTGTKT